MKSILLSDRYESVNRNVESIEDFLGDAPSNYTATATSGTVAYDATQGGVASLTTQAADNAVGSLTLDAKCAVLAAQKPISFGARIQFSEAATNAGNVIVGLHSGAVASSLQNDGAGPPSSYSGFAFFKADGSTLWSVEGSVGSTQVTRELNATTSLDGIAKTAGSASYQLLEIAVFPKTSTVCDVVFLIDGVTVAKFTDFVYTSIAAMAPIAVVKAGSATAEVLKVDFIKFAQVR